MIRALAWKVPLVLAFACIAGQVRSYARAHPQFGSAKGTPRTCGAMFVPLSNSTDRSLLEESRTSGRPIAKIPIGLDTSPSSAKKLGGLSARSTLHRWHG